tara:strand:+ start:3091 stop:3756 length:666 start_codon:yes stop_codon:yes gene_type:complete
MHNVFKLFRHPTEFFNSVKNETKYMPSLLMLVVIFFISYFLDFGAKLIVSFQQPLFIILAIMQVLLLVFVVALIFIAPFIVAGIIHLGVLIVGGKQGYFNTFKPLTYSAVVGTVWNIIITIVLLPLLSFLPIGIGTLGVFGQNTVGLEALFALGAFFLVYLAIIIPLAIAAFIHTVYVAVIGLSMFQQMSRMRAFVAIILIPLIIVLIIVMINLLILGIGF